MIATHTHRSRLFPVVVVHRGGADLAPLLTGLGRGSEIGLTRCPTLDHLCELPAALVVVAVVDERDSVAAIERALDASAAPLIVVAPPSHPVWRTEGLSRRCTLIPGPASTEEIRRVLRPTLLSAVA